MKLSNRLQGDDGDAGAGDPAEPEGRAQARSSGVRVRGLQPPLDEGPCTSCEDVITRYKRYIWSRIRRPGIAPSEVEDIFQNVVLKLDRRIAGRGMPDGGGAAHPHRERPMGQPGGATARRRPRAPRRGVRDP